MPTPRYRTEAPAPGGDFRAHGSQARAFGAIETDIAALEARTAADVPYEPATPADWVAPAPTTVAEALDRLAAAGGVTPVP